MRYKLCGWIGVLAGCAASLPASAKCGGVDYSWGADALALMHDYVVTMMLYVTLPALCHCRYCGRLRQSANLHQDEYEGRGNYP